MKHFCLPQPILSSVLKGCPQGSPYNSYLYAIANSTSAPTDPALTTTPNLPPRYLSPALLQSTTTTPSFSPSPSLPPPPPRIRPPPLLLPPLLPYPLPPPPQPKPASSSAPVSPAPQSATPSTRPRKPRPSLVARESGSPASGSRHGPKSRTTAA